MTSPDFDREQDPRGLDVPTVPTLADRQEQDRAATQIAATLRQRGARVHDDDGPDALATLLSAVERFEAARATLGADSFVNTPGSSRPDDASLVLPRRGDDEDADAYTARVLDAAAVLQARGPTS